MKSIERHLRARLAFIMVIILITLVVITNISTRILLEGYVTAKLDQDAQNILNAIKYTASPKVRPNRINPIYNKIHSGHYYYLKILYTSGEELVLRSPSLKDSDLPAPMNDSPVTLHNVIGPNDDHLIVWVNSYNFDDKAVIISVAEDMTLLKQHRQFFTLLFIGTGFMGVILILVFQRAIIRKSFQNLDTSRIELKEIETGKLQQLSEQVPSEIYPLVKEYNHSLHLMRERLQRSRNSLGNLTHAVKTPLNILMQQLDQLKEDSHEYDKNEIDKMSMQAERIRQLTERELKRAGIAGLGNSSQRFNPNEELPVLIDLLKQSHRKDDLQVVLNISEKVDVFGDREDMLELIGNLMDNAFKWAVKKMNCNIMKEAEEISIVIEDDGVGRKEQELQSLTNRGVRLDESTEGYGLGLAICKDIVKLYDGTISFSRSDNLGGFLVTIKLS